MSKKQKETYASFGEARIALQERLNKAMQGGNFIEINNAMAALRNLEEEEYNKQRQLERLKYINKYLGNTPDADIAVKQDLTRTWIETTVAVDMLVDILMSFKKSCISFYGGDNVQVIKDVEYIIKKCTEVTTTMDLPKIEEFSEDYSDIADLAAEKCKATLVQTIKDVVRERINVSIDMNEILDKRKAIYAYIAESAQKYFTASNWVLKQAKYPAQEDLEETILHRLTYTEVEELYKYLHLDNKK